MLLHQARPVCSFWALGKLTGILDCWGLLPRGQQYTTVCCRRQTPRERLGMNFDKVQFPFWRIRPHLVQARHFFFFIFSGTTCYIVEFFFIFILLLHLFPRLLKMISVDSSIFSRQHYIFFFFF